MNFSLIALLTVVSMLAGTLCVLELGRRLGIRQLAADPESAKASTGAIDGAVFGLMGLLIAFTFSGAADRFNVRRGMIVEEANAIGTAWLRLDLLPAAAQPALREKFRVYLDARIAAFQKIPDVDAMKTELNRAASLQNEIWALSISACRETGSPTATMLLIPALNEMFDTATSRTAGAFVHPPMLIYVVLGLLLLAGSFLAGIGLGVGKVRNWSHALAFVLVMTLAIYVILDFEFPRVGLIRIRGFEQVLVDLQESMKP